MPEYKAVFYSSADGKETTWDHPMTSYYAGMVASLRALHEEVSAAFATGANLWKCAEIGARINMEIRKHRDHLEKLREAETHRLADSDVQQVDTVVHNIIADSLISDRATVAVKVMSRLHVAQHLHALNDEASTSVDTVVKAKVVFKGHIQSGTGERSAPAEEQTEADIMAEITNVVDNDAASSPGGAPLAIENVKYAS